MYMMIRQNFCVTKLTKKQLKELQELMGLSESDLVRRAVEKMWEEKTRKNI